ncbi:MAG: hypothetical protein ACM3O4_05430 [Ignavibacteriales bacterium]
MAYDPIQCLKEGNINFITEGLGLSSYDLESLANRIRTSSNKYNIVKAFFIKLKDIKPKFCFDIVYDMDEYQKETNSLMEKYSFLQFDTKKIKNILFNTKWGKEYIANNLETILKSDAEERILFICEYAFEDYIDNNYLVNKLATNNNLHMRALFILYTIKNFPNKLLEIYSDITAYMTDYTYEENEQLSLCPKLMSEEDISKIAVTCLNSPLEKSVYLKLKDFILSNYKENDLAEHLLASIEVPLSNGLLRFKTNELGIEEFKADADRLFMTSRNAQFEILNRYSDNVTKDILDKFKYYVRMFQNYNNWISSPLFKIFFHGLGTELKRCIDQYLTISEDKTTDYLLDGSTSSCYRIGDYVIKLVRTKWSYEKEICPNIYLIAKNLEEFLIRNDNGIIISGLEVQKYLKRSAKDLPDQYFSRFLQELRSLGYYTTDTLINGQCGDNCRILDSYKDADCLDPETLPEHFKKMPLVLVDRDRIYSTKNKYPKQLNELKD